MKHKTISNERAVEIASKLRRMSDGSICYCAGVEASDMSEEAIPYLDGGCGRFSASDKNIAREMGISLQ